MTYGRSQGTSRRGQSWGSEVTSSILHPTVLGPIPCLVLKRGWAFSPLTAIPSCTCHQACRVGVGGLSWKKILEERQRLR